MFAKQGHVYMAGADVPFIVTDTMIIEGAGKLGFDQIQLIDRDDFPIAKLMGIPGSGEDNWDTIAIARRSGPDGEVDVPSAIRWVVDTTPAPTVPSEESSIVTAGPPGSWIDMPWKTGTIKSGVNMPFAIGLGVVGGVTIMSWGVKHMFGDGLTPKERKNILIAMGVGVAAIAGSVLFKLDKEWWWSVEGAAARAEKEISK